MFHIPDVVIKSRTQTQNSILYIETLILKWTWAHTECKVLREMQEYIELIF